MAKYNDNFNKKVVADSFVDSINEEIRKENYERIWKKYGKAISVAAIAIILASSIYTYWKKQDVADREAISDRFTAAQNELNENQPENARIHFREIGKSSKLNYATLAKLEYAAILRDNKDKSALDQYRSIFENDKTPRPLRGVAYVYYVSAALDLMDSQRLDKELPTFIKILNSEYIGKDWNLIAQETLAYCYLKLKDFKKAKNILQNLATSENIPQAMLERTRELLQFLGEFS